MASGTRPRSSSVKGKNKQKGDKGWTCSVCDEEFFNDTDKIVQCEYCMKYYCGSCLKLSTKDYEHFNMPSLHWFCAELKTIENRIVSLEQEMSKRPTTEEIQEIIHNAVGSANASGSEVPLPGNVAVPAKVLEDTVNKKIRENADRHRNIVIYNVEESGSDDAKERKQADVEFCNELLDIIEGNTDDIVKVTRIGKRDEHSESKRRPMKVILKDSDRKRSIMRNLSKLKEADEKYKRVSVTNDLTTSEREAYKEKMDVQLFYSYYAH